LTGEPPALTVEAVKQMVTGLENKHALVQAQIDEVIKQLGNVESVKSTSEDENELQQQSTTLSTELAALQARLEEQEARMSQLTEARDVAWTTYTSLANKAREINVEKSVSASESRLAFEALPPANPSAPNKKLNTAVAGALGLMLGVFSAFMIEYLIPESSADTRRDFVSAWLLAEASGLPGFDPNQETAEAKRESTEASNVSSNSSL
jgi:uncharacterized protein involved in exopolysaccharide biosynthesis